MNGVELDLSKPDTEDAKRLERFDFDGLADFFMHRKVITPWWDKSTTEDRYNALKKFVEEADAQDREILTEYVDFLASERETLGKEVKAEVCKFVMDGWYEVVKERLLIERGIDLDLETTYKDGKVDIQGNEHLKAMLKGLQAYEEGLLADQYDVVSALLTLNEDCFGSLESGITDAMDLLANADNGKAFRYIYDASNHLAKLLERGEVDKFAEERDHYELRAPLTKTYGAQYGMLPSIYGTITTQAATLKEYAVKRAKAYGVEGDSSSAEYADKEYIDLLRNLEPHIPTNLFKLKDTSPLNFIHETTHAVNELDDAMDNLGGKLHLDIDTSELENANAAIDETAQHLSSLWDGEELSSSWAVSRDVPRKRSTLHLYQRRHRYRARRG